MADELTVVVHVDEGDALGITPNENLVITQVQPGTICDGKIKLGDKIVMVNERRISDRDHFYQVTRAAFPECRLVVRRDGADKQKLEQLPPERERLVERRSGFVYFIAEIRWRPNGPKLGLGIKHHQNRVYVCRVDRGSLADGTLRVGDRLIDVDATPVSDKDVAKRLMLHALESTGEVSFIVERPDSDKARAFVAEGLRARGRDNEPPSVDMPSDVREIMAQQRQRMSTEQKPSKGILKAPVNRSPGKNIVVSEAQPTQVNIRSDTKSNKILRRVAHS